MEPYMYLLILGVVLILYFLLQYYIKEALIKRIEGTLHTFFEGQKGMHLMQPIERKGKFWRVETDEAVFLFKLFQVQSNEKIIITNRTTWIRTKGSSGIKRENSIPGVIQLVNDTREIDQNKPIYRVAIVHPGVEQIRKYINENEMVIIPMNTKVNDYYFVNSKDLSNSLKLILEIN